MPDEPDSTTKDTKDTQDAPQEDSRTTATGPSELEAERKASRNAIRHAEVLSKKLKELEDRDKTELQKAIERAETAEKAQADTASRALRYEVAAAKGLTAKQALRLIGSTREELDADADELLADIVAERRPPSFDSGARPPSGGAGDMNAALRRLAGR